MMPGFDERAHAPVWPRNTAPRRAREALVPPWPPFPSSWSPPSRPRGARKRRSMATASRGHRPVPHRTFASNPCLQVMELPAAQALQPPTAMVAVRSHHCDGGRWMQPRRRWWPLSANCLTPRAGGLRSHGHDAPEDARHGPSRRRCCCGAAAAGARAATIEPALTPACAASRPPLRSGDAGSCAPPSLPARRCASTSRTSWRARLLRAQPARGDLRSFRTRTARGSSRSGRGRRRLQSRHRVARADVCGRRAAGDGDHRIP